MRSRPKLEVYFQPSRPIPGSRLVVEVVAVSRSETPVDGIDLVLRGLERRYSHNSHNGTTSTSHYEDIRPLALVAKIPGPMTLTAGRHVHRAAFDLPPSITPSLKTRLGLVEYTLDVRVGIPWWPDRRQIYALEVAIPPTRGITQRPVTFCSAEGGPRGTALYLEASLDTTELPAGGVVEGAVSVHNVAHSRVRRVEVAFVGYDRARFRSSAAEVEDSRFVAVVADGPPPEATPVPFSIRVPEQARPSIQGALFELAYQVEIRAVVAWGSDVVMRIPCTIRPVGSSTAEPPRRGAKRLPPVGSERRRAVWAEVARRCGLDNDMEGERMRGTFGEVALSVTLEHRDDAGLWSVATLRWPALHVGLEVREKKWTDAFRAAVELDDAGFAARLWGRGREAAQVEAVLDDETRAALLVFEQVAVDDEGCVVASAGSAHAVEPLQAFVDAALRLARAFDRSRRAVPPPAAMADAMPRWEAFARQLSGRVDPGEPRVADATFEGEPVEIVTTWGAEGAPTGARVRVLRPRDARDDDDEGARPVDDAAQPLVAALRADEPSFRIDDDGFEVTVPGRLVDPAPLEPLLERLVKVARAARGEVQRGPYR